MSARSIGTLSEQPLHWSDLSDSALWNVVAAMDSMVAVGLKAPGAAHGVVRGRPVIARALWRASIGSLRGDPEARITGADSSHLPVVHLKLNGVRALTRLRALPFVDFVEPARQRVQFASGGVDAPYTGSYLVVYNSAGLPDSVSYAFSMMNIDRAWYYSKGDGVTIGITDTGVDWSGDSQFSPANFSAGDSYGRHISNFALAGPIDPINSHGTRIAGLVAAPRDGRSVVGVAYRSSVLAFNQAEDTWPQGDEPASAIHNAAVNGAKVIVMAWGMLTEYSVITNEIYAHFYNDDVMFVGAAGTCPDALGANCPRMNSAVFPSALGEVLATTAQTTSGTRPTDVYDFGSKHEGILAYTDLATTGMRRPDIVSISGSSAATGVMGGVAALVRSRFPAMSNRAVMEQIIGTSGDICRETPRSWRNSLINAAAAVGGLCAAKPAGDNAVALTIAQPHHASTYCANVTGGSGSYSYFWGNSTTGQCATWHYYLPHVPQDRTYYVFYRVTDNVTGLSEMNSINVTAWYIRMSDTDPCPPGYTCMK
jgi:subtilisin family serine protease